ncbi:MAG: glycosyltransferase family 4 protein [Eubacterium sp.]|nr:glycosyltransferase family 4 protein [Eubacterium sp.]
MPEKKQKKRKKILLITNHSYMFWQFRRELTARLLEEGDVLISTPFTGHQEDFAAMGCRMIETKIDRRGMNPGEELKLYRFYQKLLREEKPDFVLTWSVKPNLYAADLCRRMKIPYAITVQGLGTAFQKKGIRELVTMLYRRSCRGAERVFFENEGNADLFRREKITAEEKIVVLNGAGVNTESFPYVPYPDSKVFHFLYLGRLMREKGIRELFAAAERLAGEITIASDEANDEKTHAEENAIVDGKPNVGEEPQANEMPRRFVLDLAGFYEDEFEALTKQLADAGIAVWHGFQEDPAAFYAAADCIVMPSWHEGMSNVILEAEATGRPVIATDIPGCRESVENGRTGFLCEAKNADSLYAAMKEMLHLSREEREEMGRRGRQKMETEFNRADVVDRILEELRRANGFF